MALRLIMDVPKLTRLAPLFKECGILPIQDRVKFRSVVMVYKTMNGLTPTYMAKMFTEVSEVSTRQTRSSQSKKLYIPKRNLCISRQSFRYMGAILYNELDTDTQSCTSLSSFKHRAYKHFM